jgi:hypothetical protein
MPRKIVRTGEGCIYLITNLVNGKGYIGQHNEPTPYNRFGDHKMLARKGDTSCPVLYNAIRKYGEDSFTVETLWIGPLSGMNNMEEYWAEQLETYVWDNPGGYNACYCGNQGFLGRVVSQEERARVAQRMRELERTDEHCVRIGIGVSSYIASHPEEMALRYRQISETLKARGPTGPQSEKCVMKKIAHQQTRTDNISESSGERYITKRGNCWLLNINNTLTTYVARFSSREGALASRDLFIATGEKTITEFPKKVSNYGPMIRKNKNGSYMVDIHSKRFPEPFAKVFGSLEEAMNARDEFIKKYEPTNEHKEVTIPTKHSE